MDTSTQHKKYAKRIGNALAAQRMARNITQRQLAAKLGVEQETISRFERGVTLPPLSRLLDLIDIFDIPLNELLCECATHPADYATRLTLRLSVLSEDDRSWVYNWVTEVCSRLAVPD